MIGGEKGAQWGDEVQGVKRCSYNREGQSKRLGIAWETHNKSYFFFFFYLLHIFIYVYLDGFLQQLHSSDEVVTIYHISTTFILVHS